MNDKQKIADLTLAFDVGHSSLGWAVLQSSERGTGVPTRENGGVGVPPAAQPNILGCGAVIFRADDCLASKRRGYRRQRRHVRSTKLRIIRMENLLAGLGVLSPSLIEKKHKAAGGHPAPWLLAARVLAARTNVERKKSLLSWEELWEVLRWYAHNRGYDGHIRWSGEFTVHAFDPKPQVESADLEAQAEDAEEMEQAEAGEEGAADSDSDKLLAGAQLMSGYGFKTSTFAETVAKILLGPERAVKLGQPGKTGKLEGESKPFPEEDFRRLLFETPDKFRNHPRHLRTYFKGIRAAFPRRVIKTVNGKRTLVGGTEWEVRAILRAHFEAPNGMAQCSEMFEKTVCGGLPESRHDWRSYQSSHPKLYLSQVEKKSLMKLSVPRHASLDEKERLLKQRAAILDGKLILPERYEGGLLFGQLGMRFHNRIISTCRFSYARLVDAILRKDADTLKKYGADLKAVLQSRRTRGGHTETDEELARRWAAKLSKVPTKRTKEFLLYRWARHLANFTVRRPERPQLTAEERQKLHQEIMDKGFFTREGIADAIRAVAKCEPANLEQTFDATPEAVGDLVVNPVKKYLATNSLAHAVHSVLPDRQGLRLVRTLQRCKSIKVREIEQSLPEGSKEKFRAAIESYVTEENAKAKAEKKTKERVSEELEDGAANNKRNKKALTVSAVFRTSLKAPFPSARAPYHRVIMREVFDEVMQGYDPTKAKRDKDNPDGENKPAHGCLFQTPESNRLMMAQPLDTAEASAAFDRWRKQWLAHDKNQRRYEARERRQAGAGEAYLVSEFRAAESHKWLAAQSNNHIVRHRLAILERLVRDIVADPTLAGGDEKRIGKISIEVTRDILSFSGLERKQLTGRVLPSLKAHHEYICNKLARDLKGTRWEHAINGELIWKAKIADDLGWKCPYTGFPFDACDLASGKMDVDHIIPRSRRLTNAMQALVVTFKGINSVKDDLTAWEFVEKYQDQQLKGVPQKIRKLWDYTRFVKNPDGDSDKLRLSGPTGISEYPKWPKFFPGSRQKKHPDFIRRKLRRGYLLVKHYERDKATFAPRDLTITSHLNRLGQQVLLRTLPHLAEHQIVSIPGSVTGALRDARGWRLLGCLDGATKAEVMREVPKTDRYSGEPLLKPDGTPETRRIPKPKGEIRALTHLHHALDACVIAIVSHLLPKDGKLWELVAKRELNEADVAAFRELHSKYLAKWPRLDLGKLMHVVDNHDNEGNPPKHDHKWRLEFLPLKWVLPHINDNIRNELKKCRVVEHMPSDMSNLLAEETVWRVFDPNDRHPSAQRLRQWFDRLIASGDLGRIPDPTKKEEKSALIVCRKRRDAKGDDKGKTLHDTGQTWRWVYDVVDKAKLIGLREGKLSALKAVKIIGENYGVALDPTPTVIPFHKVWPRLQELKKANGGKMPRVLRNGQIIEVAEGTYKGVWKIFSIKALKRGIAFNLGRTDATDVEYVEIVDGKKIRKTTPGCKKDAALPTILKGGLVMSKHGLTGIPSCPTTSSA